MSNTRIVLLIMLIFVIITFSTSQTTTESNTVDVNTTYREDSEFTDFKERDLPFVEEKAERRIRPTNWFMFCYVFVLPVLGLGLFVCLTICCVRCYKKWKKAKVEAWTRRQQRLRSRSKSFSRTKSLDKKEKKQKQTIPTAPPPGTTMLTPMEVIVSKSLTALAGRVGSGTKFRNTPSYAGVTIPDSSRSDGSNSDKRDGKDATATEESIEDDLDERPTSLVALKKIENVGSIRG